MEDMRRFASTLLAPALAASAWLCAGCSASPGAPSNEDTSPPARVLMLTATHGFRHGSIPVAITVMNDLAASSGEFLVTPTEDVGSITATRLATVDVLMFALTSGELPFTSSQRAAILSFVNGGGGFIGIHSATDTLYEWPEYGELVGAYFAAHPWTQEGTVLVEDRDHPATSAIGPSFRILEEFYVFRENPRPRVHVLLALDPASVGASGDVPLAWSQEIGKGRSYYNALGHFDDTWRTPVFQAQLRGAVRWVTRR